MTATLIADARAFLGELAQNNTRDWFQAHKARYDADLKAPAMALLDQLTDPLSELTGAPVTGKLFRANRDVRFSKDKTPYNTHLHLAWNAGDGRAWFYGISLDYVTVGAGVFGFDKGGLDRWRAAVAGPEGEALARMLDTLAPRTNDPSLKRVPAPYPADHPRGALLRRKGLAVWQDDVTGDPAKALMPAFTRLAPIQGWLGQNVTGG